ncbi:uncharacterized protein LOC135812553 [Sycon ciliatum]|uniref:uncharacterized protein LOC135812553 n=1 Tax=Sycon ciliatum TaxID=27933 RepID=UPI0031F5F32C
MVSLAEDFWIVFLFTMAISCFGNIVLMANARTTRMALRRRRSALDTSYAFKDLARKESGRILPTHYDTIPFDIGHSAAQPDLQTRVQPSLRDNTPLQKRQRKSNQELANLGLRASLALSTGSASSRLPITAPRPPTQQRAAYTLPMSPIGDLPQPSHVGNDSYEAIEEMPVYTAIEGGEGKNETGSSGNVAQKNISVAENARPDHEYIEFEEGCVLDHDKTPAADASATGPGTTITDDDMSESALVESTDTRAEGGCVNQNQTDFQEDTGYHELSEASIAHQDHQQADAVEDTSDGINAPYSNEYNNLNAAGEKALSSTDDDGAASTKPGTEHLPHRQLSNPPMVNKAPTSPSRDFSLPEIHTLKPSTSASSSDHDENVEDVEPIQDHVYQGLNAERSRENTYQRLSTTGESSTRASRHYVGHLKTTGIAREVTTTLDKAKPLTEPISRQPEASTVVPVETNSPSCLKIE